MKKSYVIIILIAIIIFAYFYRAHSPKSSVEVLDSDLKVESVEGLSELKPVSITGELKDLYTFESDRHKVSFKLASTAPEGSVPYVEEDENGIYLTQKNLETGQVDEFFKDSFIKFYSIQDSTNAKEEMIQKIRTDVGNNHCAFFKNPEYSYDGYDVADDRMTQEQVYYLLNRGGSGGDVFFTKYPEFNPKDFFETFCFTPEGYYFPIQFTKDNSRAYQIGHTLHYPDFFGNAYNSDYKGGTNSGRITWTKTIKFTN